MLVCGAIVGAIATTAGWMFGISYVDYYVARYRRSGGGGPGRAYRQFTVERLFGMPWNQASWLASGGAVLALTFVSGLLGFGVLVLVSVAGAVVLGVIVFSDWQQLQRQPMTSLAHPTPRRPESAVSEAWIRGVRGEYAGCDFRLSGHGLTIGRSVGNALRLSDRSVSRYHAVISFGRGRWFLQDQRSSTGTFVNGRRVSATALNFGDRIRIGPTEFEFCRHRQSGSIAPVAWLRGIQGECAGRVFRLDNRGLEIGRRAGNGLILSDRSVSRRHALICLDQGRWLLRDQGSTAGTFVNGQPVSAMALKDGDRIQIGSTEFEFRLRR